MPARISLNHPAWVRGHPMTNCPDCPPELRCPVPGRIWPGRIFAKTKPVRLAGNDFRKRANSRYSLPRAHRPQPAKRGTMPRSRCVPMASDSTMAATSGMTLSNIPVTSRTFAESRLIHAGEKHHPEVVLVGNSVIPRLRHGATARAVEPQGVSKRPLPTSPFARTAFRELRPDQ